MKPHKPIDASIFNALKQTVKIIFRVCLGLAIAFLALVTLAGSPFIFQMIFTLLFGWLAFLPTVIVYLNVNSIVIFEGILVIFCLLGGTHCFMSWFCESYHLPANAATRERVKWQFKWSIAVISIFLLMFVTSISITGLVHQAGWLTKSPFTESSWSSRGYKTKDILREMGRGLESYSEENPHLPIVSQPVPFKDIKIPQIYYNGSMVDQWGMPILYSFDGNSYVLRSYGKNKILGGGSGEFDDLLYSDGEFLGDRR